MSATARRALADVCGEAASAAMVGDVVRTGRNFYPHYRVIAVTEDRAWIRDVQNGTDYIVAIDRCQKVEDGGGA